ncbi:hypothetical protein BDW67DRAFT_155464 [Aspergillus spinulosporus]
MQVFIEIHSTLKLRLLSYCLALASLTPAISLFLGAGDEVRHSSSHLPGCNPSIRPGVRCSGGVYVE